MAREARRGRGRFYTRSCRHGDRVTRVYVGTGTLAELAEAADKLRRAKARQLAQGAGGAGRPAWLTTPPARSGGVVGAESIIRDREQAILPRERSMRCGQRRSWNGSRPRKPARSCSNWRKALRTDARGGGGVPTARGGGSVDPGAADRRVRHRWIPVLVAKVAKPEDALLPIPATLDQTHRAAPWQ